MKAALDRNAGFVQAMGSDEEALVAELRSIDATADIEDFEVVEVTPRLEQYVMESGGIGYFQRKSDGTLDLRDE